MLFKTKARYNCSQKALQRCIVTEPAIILPKKMQMFILKSNLQEAPSAKHQGKKSNNFRQTKKYYHHKKTPHLKQLLPWLVLCLSFCLAVNSLVKKIHYLEFRFLCPLLILAAYSGNTFSKSKNFENK